jgi:hypothetical protein
MLPYFDNILSRLRQPNRLNQSLQLTAARTAFTFSMIRTSHLYLTLGSSSRS